MTVPESLQKKTLTSSRFSMNEITNESNLIMMNTGLRHDRRTGRGYHFARAMGAGRCFATFAYGNILITERRVKDNV